MNAEAVKAPIHFAEFHLSTNVRFAKMRSLGTYDSANAPQSCAAKRSNGRGGPQFANGSGRNWMCTARGIEPLPPSLSHGVRAPFVLHKPRPFQPALGSSIRPSKPLA